MTAQGAVQRPTGPLLTPDHARVLLGTLSALDPRLAAKTDGDAAIRVNAWASLLAEVDPGYAMRYAQHAYQQVRDWPLQPAEILQAWRSEQAADRATDEQVHRHRTAGERQQASAVMRQYVRDCFAAMQAGQPFESVPRPEGVSYQPTPEQEARERRCVFWRICACDHTRCRDGFSDTEEVIIGVHGHRYPAVARCPHCNDALLMAEEKGIAQKPSRNHGRRR